MYAYKKYIENDDTVGQLRYIHTIFLVKKKNVKAKLWLSTVLYVIAPCNMLLNKDFSICIFNTLTLSDVKSL